MKKSRIKLIKEIHAESNNVWKEAIKKEFPKIFKKEGFEVGDWVVRKWRDSDFDILRVSEAEGNKYKADIYIRNMKEDYSNDDKDDWIYLEDNRIKTYKIDEEILKKITP